MKTCYKCKVEKTFDNFAKRGKNLQSYCKQCQTATKRVWLSDKDNLAKHNLNKMWTKYRLRPADIKVMLVAQNRACGVCEVAFSEEIPYQVDHDHKCCDRSGSCGNCVRGLLCGNCNRAMIWADRFSEDPNFFNKLSQYGSIE